jgi:lipid II:glycine glycyltransferase (peptidoglycan interpeptide bridge formation enzyme)
MEIKQVTSRDNWKESSANSSFLQKWSWGEFKQDLGKEVLRLQLIDQEEVLSQIQGVVHQLGLGVKYVYLPRVNISDNFDKYLDYLSEQNFAFLRVEPQNKRVVTDNFQQKEIDNRQPRTTLILDVTPAKDDLLDDMHSKTRYNIRLSYRKDIETRQKQDLNIFYNLYEETTKRADFTGHPKEYFKKMLELDNVYQLISYYEDKPLSSIILIATDNTLTYLHGASTREHSERMATYQSQWEGIQLAKKLGCDFYDFWGIAPIVDEETENTDKSFGYIWPQNHELSGVTRFKVRFNGEVENYPKAQNIIFSPAKYKMYNLGRKIL